MSIDACDTEMTDPLAQLPDLRKRAVIAEIRDACTTVDALHRRVDGERTASATALAEASRSLHRALEALRPRK